MMEAKTLTLADFLRARIDEEWPKYHRIDPEDCGCTDCLTGWSVPSIPTLDAERRRALADCEAKLRIVEHYQGHLQAQANAGEIQAMITEMAVLALADVLTMLALPYADHPDYREEWRPYGAG